MRDASENFSMLLGAFFMDKPVPRNVQNWFLDGALKAIRRSDSLETGLGIKGAGRCSLQRAFMLRVRDENLIDALEHVSLDASLSTWARCLRLAPLTVRFRTDVWPRYKYADQPPDDWPSYQKSLWRAAKTDLPLPKSPDALRAVVVKAGGYRRNSEASILRRITNP